jgi:hypothetical protein
MEVILFACLLLKLRELCHTMESHSATSRTEPWQIKTEQNNPERPQSRHLVGNGFTFWQGASCPQSAQGVCLPLDGEMSVRGGLHGSQHRHYNRI